MPSRLLINIDVPDILAGIAFYCGGLGFQLQRRLFGGAVAELRLGDQHVYLIAQPAGQSPSLAGQPHAIMLTIGRRYISTSWWMMSARLWRGR